MSRYQLHDLADTEFESLVTAICRKILGAGTTSFRQGPDGGKDASFEGRANCFPSESSPVEGKIVIQAKHTTAPTLTCSDNSFFSNKTSIVNEEIPKIKRQVSEEGVTHYILFTNRKKTGGNETKIPAHIKHETGVCEAWLRGEEDILGFLSDYPEIAKSQGLDRLRSPILFTPEDIRDVVVAIHENKKAVSDAFDSQHDFRGYPGIQEKNRINQLTTQYYKYIEEDSLPRFAEIEHFLKNSRNADFAEKYHAVADELKGQIIAFRDRFSTFDDVLEHVFNLMHERCSTLKDPSRRRLTKIIVHYMYCDCDIGEKS